MRPVAGVVPLAIEAVAAGKVWHVGGREAPDGGDEVRRAIGPALLGPQVPEARRIVPLRACDAGVEVDILAHIQLVRRIVHIADNLRLFRIALRPLPAEIHVLGEGEAIGVALGIAARAGIAVPVPGAANPVAGLDHPSLHAELVAQQVELVHAGKTGADDQGVETLAVGCSCHGDESFVLFNRVGLPASSEQSARCEVRRHTAMIAMNKPPVNAIGHSQP